MVMLFLILLGCAIFGALILLNVIELKAAAFCAFFFVSIAGITAFVQYNSKIKDVEILNGYVLSKSAWKFMCPMNTGNPCRNSYPCNCHPVQYVCGSDAKTGAVEYCTRIECDTCYTYPWEQNWYVKSTLFNRMEINRIDEQGADEPPRWTVISKDDAVSAPHTYVNWVQAAYKSLFHEDSANITEELKSKVPAYPAGIYDYYKINRLVTIGYNPTNSKEWNEKLSDTLRYLGATKQVNIIIVMYKGFSDTFPITIRHVWHGFKKNDAIVFVKMDSDNMVEKFDVMSWSRNDIFNVTLRDELNDRYQGTTIDNVSEFMHILNMNTNKYYVRREMKEFEYLKDDIETANHVYYTWAISLLLGLILSIILTHQKPLDIITSIVLTNN